MVSKKIISGTFWTSLSTIIVALVQISRLGILARFLDKTDFGIVAILTFVLGLTHTFCDMGFSSAIMHKQDLNSKEFSSLYWLQFIVFILMYIVMCGLSYPISTIYKEPILRTLIPIALLDLLFKGFGQLYETLLLKNFQFKVIAVRNVISSILSLFIAIVLAIKGMGVYSLIISTLFNTLMLNLWNLLLGYKRLPLKKECSFSIVKPLVKIGLYQTGTQIVDYISSKVDILLIGKFLGTADLGIYNLAKELAMKIVQVFNGIVNRVAMPYLSNIQNDQEGLRRNYSKLLSIISTINFPVCSILGCLSIPIVGFLYGDSYAELAPLTSLFCVWSIIACVGNPIGNIVIATGRTDLSFKYTLIRVAIYIPAIWILVHYSLYVVIIGQIVLGILVSIFISWYMLLYKTINMTCRQFINSFLSTAIFSIVIILPIYYIVKNNVLDLPSNNILQTIIYGIMLVIVYFMFLYNTKKDIITSLLGSIKK